jgi:hypothetical protein
MGNQWLETLPTCQDGHFLYYPALANSQLSGKERHLSLIGVCLSQQSSDLVHFLAPTNKGRRDWRFGNL